MKLNIYTNKYQVHAAFLGIAILTLAFAIFAYATYIKACHIKTNGRPVKAKVTAVFCLRKKKNNGTLTLNILGENVTKKLKVGNCTFVHVGDTLMVQYLSANEDILEFKNGKLPLNRYVYPPILGTIAAIIFFVMGFKKNN